MIFWRIEKHYTTALQKIKNQIQLTLFAVAKSPDSDRLMSWARVVNYFCPDPPEPDFPDPPLFAQVRSVGASRSAIFLEVDNMFHKQILSHQLADLFPLPPIYLSQLPSKLNAK